MQSSSSVSIPNRLGSNQIPRQIPHHYLIEEYSTPAQHPSIPQSPPDEQAEYPEAQSPPRGTPSTSMVDSRQDPDHQPPIRPHRNGGFFGGAHHFTIEKAVMNDRRNSDNFMSVFLKEVISGAAFDDSERDPPPRCHPGTRLAIVNEAQYFIANCVGERKMLWIVGPAGVGKSAIMQTIAETTSTGITNDILGASIFFSIRGRSDGSKAITTLAYQLAVIHPPYPQFVQNEVTNDPSLLHKSVTVQFNKFIVEPFTHPLRDPHRFLILIDGLDECNGHHAQCELLELISDFCITYPSSPIVWVIASRPEPHITSFFTHVEVIPVYRKEEVKVDSNEACEDVERFLRSKLKKVQLKSFTLKDLPQWPTESDFLKIADASKGLFAYASTVVKFVDDPGYGDPALQLEQVLEVIDTSSKWLTKGKSHPMAHLDALYWRILSRVPADVMVNTRKLLLLMIDNFWSGRSSVRMCNWLGMTKNAAYGATYHLRSVLDVPEPDKARYYGLQCFHKSFTSWTSIGQVSVQMWRARPDSFILRARAGFSRMY